MSSTNLTDGRSSVCFFMINCERNHLKYEKKAGDASKVNPQDAKNLSTNLGVSTMVIPQRGLMINDKGHRGNGSQRQDMEKMDYKKERMKKINAAKLQEKKPAKKKESNTGHDEQEI